MSKIKTNIYIYIYKASITNSNEIKITIKVQFFSACSLKPKFLMKTFISSHIMDRLSNCKINTLDYKITSKNNNGWQIHAVNQSVIRRFHVKKKTWYVDILKTSYSTRHWVVPLNLGTNIDDWQRVIKLLLITEYWCLTTK